MEAMSLWMTLITVAGGILTGIVGFIAAAMKKLWDEVRETHHKHVTCEANRLSDRIQHWGEMEEMRRRLGLDSKPPPTAKDTQIVTPPLPATGATS